MTDIVERLPAPQRIAPVKAAPVSTMCNDWPVAYQTGNSQEDGEDWGIVTDNVRASLFVGLDFPLDAKDDAEFLAYLVNAYRTGQLVTADTITSLRVELAEARRRFNDVDMCQNGQAPCDWSLKLIARAETAEAALRSQRAEVLREAAYICQEFEHSAEERNWRDGAQQARRIEKRILALIDAPKEQQP